MTREDLKKYRHNQMWIDEQIELYKEQKERAEGLKSTVIDGLPKSKNHTSYAIENLIDKYDYILDILDKDQEKQNQVIIQLKEVEEPFRAVLTKFYIQGKTLVKVADEMNYTYEYTKKLNKIGLRKFDDIEKRSQNVTE